MDWGYALNCYATWRGFSQKAHWRKVRVAVCASIIPSDLRFALAFKVLAKLQSDRGDDPPPNLSALISAAPDENAAQFFQEFNERVLPQERIAKQSRDFLHATARSNWMTKSEAIQIEVEL